MAMLLQHMQGDMSTFSDGGKSNLGGKSSLLNALMRETQNTPPNTFHVKMVDCAAVMPFLIPQKKKYQLSRTKSIRLTG